MILIVCFLDNLLIKYFNFLLIFVSNLYLKKDQTTLIYYLLCYPNQFTIFNRFYFNMSNLYFMEVLECLKLVVVKNKPFNLFSKNLFIFYFLKF